jgi:hypothetical protein
MGGMYNSAHERSATAPMNHTGSTRTSPSVTRHVPRHLPGEEHGVGPNAV